MDRAEISGDSLPKEDRRPSVSADKGDNHGDGYPDRLCRSGNCPLIFPEPKPENINANKHNKSNRSTALRSIPNAETAACGMLRRQPPQLHFFYPDQSKRAPGTFLCDARPSFTPVPRNPRRGFLRLFLRFFSGFCASHCAAGQGLRPWIPPPLKRRAKLFMRSLWVFCGWGTGGF